MMPFPCSYKVLMYKYRQHGDALQTMREELRPLFGQTFTVRVGLGGQGRVVTWQTQNS